MWGNCTSTVVQCGGKTARRSSASNLRVKAVRSSTPASRNVPEQGTKEGAALLHGACIKGDAFCSGKGRAAGEKLGWKQHYVDPPARSSTSAFVMFSMLRVAV